MSGALNVRSFASVAGSATISLIAAFSFAAIVSATFAGANTPTQLTATNGKPPSPQVGMSAYSGTRCSLETARPRIPCDWNWPA
jgi:hypothetical protein